MDYTQIYNIFALDGTVPVCIPLPSTIQEGYMYHAALAFGKPIPEEDKRYPMFLYGQKFKPGNQNDDAAEADRDVRENGLKLIIPEWVTHLDRMIGDIVNDQVSEAYARGKSHGKSLLHRLATGDMSILNFEDRRS